MKNLLKRWWRQRLNRYYLKTRWYLIVDLILMTVFLTLLLVLFYLKYQTPLVVDITPVKHIGKEEEVVVKGNSLMIESEVDKSNIYNEKEFKLKIKVTNTGKIDLNNIDLALLLNNNKFSLSRIKSLSPESNFKLSGRKIWLDTLPVGSSQEIQLSLFLKNLPDSPRLITWKVSGSYLEANLKKEVSYELPELKLISTLNVKAAAYYHSPQGDQLGVGPIPPQVSLPTNYWIFFTLDNIGNKLSNLVVTAKLAGNVSFFDNKSLSAGDLMYNAKKRELTWQVKNVEAVADGYQVGFELQLLPSERQVGSVPDLLTDLTFSVYDLYAEEVIGDKLPTVDTNLTFDPVNKGQGVVVK